MMIHEVNFDGALLQRGFWVYMWRVTQGGRAALYVGRTGDSSSRFAASPFSRLGQHLDLRTNATANMLLRNLRQAGFDPLRCSYSLFAAGPLYPEQDDLTSHRPVRDLVAAIEAAVAAQLRADGYIVLGKHPKVGDLRNEMYEQVLQGFRDALKPPTG